VPVIYMTGNEDPAVRKAALDSGCIALLTKPFSVQALMEPLKNVSAERTERRGRKTNFAEGACAPGRCRCYRRCPPNAHPMQTRGRSPARHTDTSVFELTRIIPLAEWPSVVVW